MDDVVDVSVDTARRRPHEVNVIDVCNSRVGVVQLVLDEGRQIVYTGPPARRRRVHNGFVDALRECDSERRCLEEIRIRERRECLPGEID